MCSIVSLRARIGARPSGRASAADADAASAPSGPRPRSPNSGVRRWRRAAAQRLAPFATASATRASRRSCPTSRSPERDQLGERFLDLRAQQAACRRRSRRRTMRRARAGSRRRACARELICRRHRRGRGRRARPQRRAAPRQQRRPASCGSGPRCPPRSSRGGVSRVHTARPDRHRSSSHVKS